MTDQWFLWPDARFLRGGIGALGTSTPDALETFLARRYGGRGYPVVVSSGRIGLVLALDALGVRRSDLVGLFPFASHCVIESVGRVGSPVSGGAAATTANRVLYHQWGYVQERSALGAFLEDAVDTFCLPGAALFPAGGPFEVWSLAKLTGSLGGGVLWCRDQSAATEIRRRRDQRNAATTLRWMLRVFSSRWQSLVPLWYGAESAGGAPPSWGCGDILHGLQRWDDIAETRRERIAVVHRLLPSWLTIDSNRLPTVVPMVATEEQGEQLMALGFSAGFRHFERVTGSSREVVRMFPIPVHQDVPVSVLQRACQIVGCE